MTNEQEVLDSNIKENWFSRVGVQKPYTVFVCIMVILILGVFAFSTLKTELFPNMDLPYAVVVLAPDQTQSAIKDAIAAEMAKPENAGPMGAEITAILQNTAAPDYVAATTAIGKLTNPDPEIAKDGQDELNDLAKEYPNGVAASYLRVAAKYTTEAYMMVMPTLAHVDVLAGDVQTALASVTGVVKIESVSMLSTGTVMAMLEYASGARIETAALILAINNGVTLSDPAYGVVYRNANIMQLDPSLLPIMSITVSGGSSTEWYKDEVLTKLKSTDGVGDVTTNLDSTGGDMSWQSDGAELTETVSFSINKISSAITTEAAANVIGTLEKIKAANADFNYEIITSQAEYINDSLGSVGENLIVGGILAILILFLFLRSVKMTLAIGISIPIAVIATFVAMHFMGIGLNIVSMSGLALAVGMLVDNSVVVLENIYRLRAKGVSIKDSAIRGASQIMGAMLASTLTTICVFFPMFFLTGMLMQVFMDLIWVIILSLSCSLLVAVMFLPGIISSFKIDAKVKKAAAENAAPKKPNIFVRFSNAVKKGYEKALNFSIAKNWLIILLAVIVLGGSVGLLWLNGFTLMPSTDEGDFTISATLTPTAGGNADKKTLADELYSQVRNELGDNLENCLIRYSSGTAVMDILQGKTTGGMTVSITLKAKRSISTDRAAEAVGTAIKAANDAVSENDRVYGDIQYSSSSMTAGMVEEDVSVTFVSSDADIDIANENLDDAAEALVGLVEDSADDVGITNIEWSRNKDRSINQTDRRVTTTVTFKKSAAAKIGDVQSFVDGKVAEVLAMSQFSDVSTMDTGFDAQLNETYRSLGIALVVGLVLIYLVMVAIFQSFIMPAIILICIPLAFTGAFIALAICGMPLSVPALIGFLILMGVIVNNGILAVDYTNQARRDGLSVKDALVAAMRTRMRPIFMTAITTILGLLPMALGLSLFGAATGSALMQPLAVVSIGGLLYGTLTTLLVVPAFYAIFCRDKKHIDKVCEEPKSQQAGQTA